MSTSSTYDDYTVYVHQTWKSKDIPRDMQHYVDSWLKSPYTYKFYTDDDLRQVVSDHYPQYLEAYDSFDVFIERVDFARYCILHHYGGIYADIDVELLRPFPEEWLCRTSDKVILGYEPPEHCGKDKLVCNALMISPPGHPYWISLMDYIVSQYKQGGHVTYNPVNTTGPE